ncbi:hypothetical protein BGLA2_370016 [Burkholderia gladioli]|nr:hypothetical protein BGLA2_370016 [Burkholderia gladioli]
MKVMRSLYFDATSRNALTSSAPMPPVTYVMPSRSTGSGSVCAWTEALASMPKASAADSARMVSTNMKTSRLDVAPGISAPMRHDFVAAAGGNACAGRQMRGPRRHPVGQFDISLHGMLRMACRPVFRLTCIRGVSRVAYSCQEAGPAFLKRAVRVSQAKNRTQQGEPGNGTRLFFRPSRPATSPCIDPA